MIKKDFTVVSDYDGLSLKGLIYEPENSPKGIVQLVHGMCEYKKRYEPFMEFLAQNGYIAACYDQRGHGDTVEKDTDFGWMNDCRGKAIVEDCAKVTKWLKSTYPDLPVTLLGHSMGSMVVRCYLRKHDDLIDKLVVSGSPTFNPLAGVAVLLAKTIRFFRGSKHRSKMLAFLSTGKGKQEFKNAGKGSWLTHDDENVKAYYSDPHCGFIFTVNGFENLFHLMKFTYKKRGYRVQNPNLRIHFISGSDDAVLGGEKNWQPTLDFMRQVGYTQVSGTLYPDFRHEVLNEIGKEKAYADVLNFIEG